MMEALQAVFMFEFIGKCAFIVPSSYSIYTEVVLFHPIKEKCFPRGYFMWVRETMNAQYCFISQSGKDIKNLSVGKKAY